MRWQAIKDEPCSVARTLSIIGDRWTLLVIRDCFLGTRCFEDFQKQLKVTRHLLSDRLRKLVDRGILEKVTYTEHSRRFEYRLTEKGVDLFPIIMAIVRWGDQWMAEEGAPPIEYEHVNCGKKMKAVLCCSECHEEIQAKKIRPMIGPGLQHFMKDPKNHYLRETKAYKFLENSSRDPHSR